MAHLDRLSSALMDAEASALRLLESVRVARTLVPRVASEAVVQDRLDVPTSSPTRQQPAQASPPPRSLSPTMLARVQPSPSAAVRQPRKEFSETLSPSKVLLGASQRARPQPRRLEDPRKEDASALPPRAEATFLIGTRGSPLRKSPVPTNRHLPGPGNLSPPHNAEASPSRMSLGELGLGRPFAQGTSRLVGGPGSIDDASGVSRVTGRDGSVAVPAGVLDAEAEHIYARAEDAVSEALSVASAISMRRTVANPPAAPAIPHVPAPSRALPPPASRWLQSAVHGARRTSDGGLTADSLASEDFIQQNDTSGGHRHGVDATAASAPHVTGTLGKGVTPVPPSRLSVVAPTHREAASASTLQTRDADSSQRGSAGAAPDCETADAGFSGTAPGHHADSGGEPHRWTVDDGLSVERQQALLQLLGALQSL